MTTTRMESEETLKKRISNVEGMYSICFKKIERSLRLVEVVAPTPRRAKPSFVILRFDIRYSAVRCFIQAIEVASLIVTKPYHFGVVSYERLIDTTWKWIPSENPQCQGRMCSPALLEIAAR